MFGIDSPVREGSPMGKYQIILNKSLFIHMSGKSLELIGLVQLLPFLGCTPLEFIHEGLTQGGAPQIQNWFQTQPKYIYIYINIL